MKHGIYFYNPLTRHLPCEQAKPLREHMKRLRDFSRALFASCESASRNSLAMRRRASALPAAFRSHPRESAMKPRTYFYNSITRHRPAKSPQSPRDRSLFSRTSLPSREPAMKHGIYFYNPLTRHLPCEQAKPLREHMKRLRDFSRALFASCESASRNSLAMRRRASALPAAFRSHPRESAMKPRIYFYNPLTCPYLLPRPIIETTRRHRLRGLSRAIAKRRPWRKIAGNRPARGFQNFSIECSIFVHKKAKMGGYTVSIETKGGNGL